jgi:hypothetical protein
VGIAFCLPTQGNSSIDKASSSSSLMLGSNTFNESSLNFKNIEKFEVPNSKATVIYVPQVHKDPTTQAKDPKNDQAVVAQREIYSILNDLVSNNRIKYVMDETDIYGPMPKEKIGKIQSGFSDETDFRNNLKIAIDQYIKAGGSQDTALQVEKNAEKVISNFDRNIYLTGGAAVLAANNSNAHVYGSQDEVTLNESKDRLQNIVYLENRIAELDGTSKQSSISSNQPINNILSLLRNTEFNNNPLQPLKTFATTSDNKEMLDSINKAGDSLKNLSVDRSFEAISKFSDRTLDDNPYKNINNLSYLKKEYDKQYKEFMSIVKDQRSQEVADNIDKMMTDNNQKVSALVFGAQHKEQIVDALNKKGISVIVVTSDAVLSYENTNTKG